MLFNISDELCVDNDNEFIFQFVQVVYINTIYEYINQ